MRPVVACKREHVHNSTCLPLRAHVDPVVRLPGRLFNAAFLWLLGKVSTPVGIRLINLRWPSR